LPGKTSVSIFTDRLGSGKSDSSSVDAAKNVAPSLGIDASKLSKGALNYDPSKVTHYLYYSAEKREKILGIKVRSKEESTRDTLADFKARGWIA